MSENRTVGIMIFDDVEVLDFCGPFEVFSVAAPPGIDRDSALFRALTIAKSRDLVHCKVAWWFSRTTPLSTIRSWTS